MLSPSWLSGALTYEQGLGETVPSVLDQLAFADFLARGELDRHLRRMRRRYRARREALISELTRAAPGARATGAPAGLYALVLLAPGIDEHPVLRAAAARGVALEGLSAHARSDAAPGIVLGYASLSIPEIETGLAALAHALTDI